MSNEDQHTRTLLEFYRVFYNEKRFDEGAGLLAENFINHHPGSRGTGRQGMIDDFGHAARSIFPEFRIETKRVIAEGAFVWTHSLISGCLSENGRSPSTSGASRTVSSRNTGTSDRRLVRIRIQTRCCDRYWVYSSYGLLVRGLEGNCRSSDCRYLMHPRMNSGHSGDARVVPFRRRASVFCGGKNAPTEDASGAGADIEAALR